MDDLLRDLIATPSVNPTLFPGAAGEAAVGELVARWMRDAGLDVEVTWPAPGRPNVIGVARGSGGGRSLLLVAHTDTVGVDGMDDPFVPRVHGDRLVGRGAYDMKSGLAAAMAAAAALQGLAGDVIVAAVCDEEAGSLGTRALLADGVHADACIVTEPTDLGVAVAHKGFAGFEIQTNGRAAHGSEGVAQDDAILKMAPVLQRLGALDARLRAGTPHPVLGTGSVHASLIAGGQEASSYPERCVLTGEWRTVPGNRPQDDLAQVAGDAELRMTYTGAPLDTPPDGELSRLLAAVSGSSITAMPYWADSALVAAAGIPTVLFGPRGGGAHAVDEWVELASVARVRDVIIAFAERWCGLAQMA